MQNIVQHLLNTVQTCVNVSQNKKTQFVETLKLKMI